MTRDNHRTPGETGPAFDRHCHCEPVRTLVWQSASLRPHRGRTAHCAAGDTDCHAPMGLAMTVVVGGWSFCFRWRSTHFVGGGSAARPMVRISYAEREPATGREVLLDFHEARSTRPELAPGPAGRPVGKFYSTAVKQNPPVTSLAPGRKKATPKGVALRFTC